MRVLATGKIERGLTVHGCQDVADLRSGPCINWKDGTGAFIDVETIVAMVSNRQPYETCRPDFIGCTAVSAVFRSTIDCLADRSIFIPIREVFSEVKRLPA